MNKPVIRGTITSGRKTTVADEITVVNHEPQKTEKPATHRSDTTIASKQTTTTIKRK